MDSQKEMWIRAPSPLDQESAMVRSVEQSLRRSASTGGGGKESKYRKLRFHRTSTACGTIKPETSPVD